MISFNVISVTLFLELYSYGKWIVPKMLTGKCIFFFFFYHDSYSECRFIILESLTVLVTFSEFCKKYHKKEVLIERMKNNNKN